MDDGLCCQGCGHPKTLSDLSAWAAADMLNHYLELGEKVIDQTERRVFQGESVPATEKIVYTTRLPLPYRRRPEEKPFVVPWGRRAHRARGSER